MLIPATVLLAVDIFKDYDTIVPFGVSNSETIHEKGTKNAKTLEVHFFS